MAGTKAPIAAVLVVAAVLCTTMVLSPDDPGEYDGQVFILHTNDTHGHYSDTMSFAQVAGMRDYLESEGATVFLLDAGDTFQGSSVTMLTHGESSVDVLNAVGYDAMCPGNHEFDYSVPTYLSYADRLNFPTLSANITWAFTGEYVFEPYTVLEKGGVRLGVFGLTTIVTPEEALPGIVSDLEFSDPVAAARGMVSTLGSMDCDYIVCLGHLGVNHNEGISSDTVCSQVEGIDLFIDGHSHTEMSGGKVCDGSVTLYESDTVIASTGSTLTKIGFVSLGDTIEASLLSEADHVNPKVKNVIDAKHAEMESILSVVIGSSEVELNGERTFSRLHESPAADYITDALREYAHADLMIINGGSFRGSFHVGDITVNDIYTIVPFEGTLVTKQLTGQQILEGLENSISMYPDPVGRFLQVSGMTVTYDTSQAPGNRVVSVTVGTEGLDVGRTYLVASTPYVMLGGDGFTMFDDGNEFQTLGLINDLLIDHIRDAGTITAGDVHTGRLFGLPE